MDRAARLLHAHIDEAPGDVGGVGIGEQLLCQRHPYTARADDGDLDLVLGLTVRVDQFLPGENPQQQSQEGAEGGIGRAHLKQ